MEKQIFTIGYTIPTFDENYVDFYDGASLMDADILLISPDVKTPPPKNPNDVVNGNIRKGYMMAAGDKDGKKHLFLLPLAKKR